MVSNCLPDATHELILKSTAMGLYREKPDDTRKLVELARSESTSKRRNIFASDVRRIK